MGLLAAALLLLLVLVLVLEPLLLHDPEVVQDFVSPLPLLLGREHVVFGQRCEVLPVVHGEGLKIPIRALRKDVVRFVLCHSSLLYALERLA